jgi:hypothetical protein
MRETDKLRLPPRVNVVAGSWWVFERHGCLVGAARVETWQGGDLHVSGLWLASENDELCLDCGRALLHAFPAARRLLEPTSEIALNPVGGLGAALIGARA